jgi:hypothetical protein
MGGDVLIYMKCNIRDLTRSELRDIRKLVISMCANYDHCYGCLALDSDCYMLTKRQTGFYCNYFRNALLPLNRELQRKLNDESVADNMKQCEICGKELFINSNRTKYCKPCARKTHRRKKTESEQKRRRIVDK